MVYLDINYMKGFKDFTIDTESFPDLAGLSAELKEEGVRLVPIIDAGIKVLEGDPTAEEGIENGYFCTKEDGTPLHRRRLAGALLLHRLLKPRGTALVRDALTSFLTAIRASKAFWNDHERAVGLLHQRDPPPGDQRGDGSRHQGHLRDRRPRDQALAGIRAIDDTSTQYYKEMYLNVDGQADLHGKTSTTSTATT